MKYEGYNGQITVEGDQLVITRDGMVARTAFGKATPPRSIPLPAISGVTLQEASRLKNGWLQLHLGGQVTASLTPSTAASNGDAVMFTHGKREQWTQLYTWLQSVVEKNREFGIDPSTVQYDDSGSGQIGRFDKLAAKVDAKGQEMEQNAAAKAEERAADATARAAQQQDVKRAKGEAAGLRPDIAEAASRMGWQFGGKREIKKLHEHLYEGEIVEYIAQGTYAGNQGIVVLTNGRMLFLFHGLMNQTLEDFPYKSLSSVQSKAGLATGELAVHASGNNAVISGIVKPDLKHLGDALRQRIAAAGQPVAPAPAQPDIMEQLKGLAELRDAGILTSEEFDAKKAELLSRL